ncbi:hypothetical protein B2J93_3192 [Marssonina coronariae]|uniref:Uncharacterized protein n=1 Tax=Diplocarpon coronariae TaxID=2795749 RepID=A0A218Z3X1_9HELO|nr:hypothetical protein B2J93_3192 [Marssonina coronariae]
MAQLRRQAAREMAGLLCREPGELAANTPLCACIPPGRLLTPGQPSSILVEACAPTDPTRAPVLATVLGVERDRPATVSPVLREKSAWGGGVQVSPVHRRGLRADHVLW